MKRWSPAFPPFRSGRSLAFPQFRARLPWWGPDLQTLRNSLVRPRPGFDGARAERLRLRLADGSGDALSALLQRPMRETRRPLALLIHGLGGSEESAYMASCAAHLLSRGHPVLRLNLRGAGPSRPLCRLQYHAGRSGDLRDALRALPPDLAAPGVVLVGFSLGGNMLLKFMAECDGSSSILGAVSVSAPIDLEAASRRFLDRRNRVYHWHLLRGMKRESTGPGAALSPVERRAIAEVRSVWEFDDCFVAPRNGYADAREYYARNAARNGLHEIRLPTLVIHALDDPWIPAQPYLAFPWRENPALLPLLAAGGGHVGFHDRGGAEPWHERCMAAFFDQLGAREASGQRGR